MVLELYQFAGRNVEEERLVVKHESKWIEEVAMVTRHVLLSRRQLPG